MYLRHLHACNNNFDEEHASLCAKETGEQQEEEQEEEKGALAKHFKNYFYKKKVSFNRIVPRPQLAARLWHLINFCAKNCAQL